MSEIDKIHSAAAAVPRFLSLHVTHNPILCLTIRLLLSLDSIRFDKNSQICNSSYVRTSNKYTDWLMVIVEIDKLHIAKSFELICWKMFWLIWAKRDTII